MRAVSRSCPVAGYLALVVSSVLAAAQAGPPTLRIPHVVRAPSIEDFLNGTTREAEAVVTDFRQYEPGDGTPASVPTTAYLSYDDRNLYVVFVCQDDPAKVRARLSKREDIDADDRVGVKLDTFHDHQHQFVFIANPLGVQQDQLATEGAGGDVSFDTLWYSQGRVTSTGYVVWMAIPFKSLRFARGPVQNWGIAIGRAIHRNDETVYWPYITQRIEGETRQFAHTEGLENISPGRNVQLIPYFAFRRARALDQVAPSGPGFRTDTEARPGLDAKLVLRDALTLDLTANPDFSQVESDEPQVTINQRFEVYFPEKRPFFIENASYFQTPVNLFFSRRIADPQGGARLTGKVGRWNLGVLASDDRGPGKVVPRSDPLWEERAAAGVARVQRQFAGESTIGVLASSMDFGASFNRVVSLDTRLKLNANWITTGQAIGSFTRQVDGTSLVGSGYSFDLARKGRNLTYFSNYTSFSPEFRTDLGFVPRVDMRKLEHFVQYYWKPKAGPVVLFGPDVDSWVIWGYPGQVQEWRVSASFGANLKGPTGLGCNRKEIYELFQQIGFRYHATDCGINSEWLPWLAFTADYGWGSAVNYFPGGTLLPFLANQDTAMAGFTFRPTPRLSLQQTYLYGRLQTRAAGLAAEVPPAASLFNNHIARTKMNFQFTRELSLRLILDYNAVLPNPALVALEPAKRFTGDVLVTYLLNPGTAVYVGYTDNLENLRFAGLPPALQRSGPPGVSTGRQFFVKTSYLFRF